MNDFCVRVWHLFQTHPNFNGEMTHNLFVKHYRIDKASVSSMGNVYYNMKHSQWEIEPNKPLVLIKEDRANLDAALVVNIMNNVYGSDADMINASIKEQQYVLQLQKMKNLNFGR